MKNVLKFSPVLPYSLSLSYWCEETGENIHIGTFDSNIIFSPDEKYMPNAANICDTLNEILNCNNPAKRLLIYRGVIDKLTNWYQLVYLNDKITEPSIIIDVLNQNPPDRKLKTIFQIMFEKNIRNYEGV